MFIGYLSVKETSEILGYSDQYVRQLLRSGELNGEIIGNRWVVASESTSEYFCEKDNFNLLLPDHARRSAKNLRSKPSASSLVVWDLI